MAHAEIDVTPTAVPGLDLVLGGGFPQGSLVMLVGAPGTGKTILLQQIAFYRTKGSARKSFTASPNEKGGEGANLKLVGSSSGSRPPTDFSNTGKENDKVLYFSTLSEPHDKLLQHIRQFDFFEEELLNNGIQFLSLTAEMEGGLEKVGSLIINTTRREKARLVIIDSFAPLAALAPSNDALRRFIYQLSSLMGLLECTLLISIERTPGNSISEDELALADGIIGLYSRIEGVREMHRVEVRKLRGMNRLAGFHTYKIDQTGLTFYPRLEELISNQLDYAGSNPDIERLKLDLPRLEEMLNGGLPDNSTTIIAGSLGTGKTLIALHYLMAGARKGEQGCYIGFQESREELFSKGERFGLDLRRSVENGQIKLLTFTPVQLEPDIVSCRLRELVESSNIKRFVLDGYPELERVCRLEGRSYDYTAALVNYFKEHEITSLFTYEIQKLIGEDLDLSDTPFVRLAENLILLRQVIYDRKLHRVLSILKMRDSDYDRRILEFDIIDGSGIDILEMLDEGSPTEKALERGSDTNLRNL